MPYQRIADKEAAQQQQQQPVAPEQDLQQHQVRRGAPDLNAPNSPEKAFNMVQDQVRPGSAALMGPDQEATPEEQAEYERAVGALSKVLYENDQTSSAIVRQLVPEERIGSVAKASMLIIQQLDDKFDFDETVIPELTQETVDRVIDLFENSKLDDEFTEQEAQAALGATWEGVMEMYGIDEDQYAEMTAGMSQEDFKGFENEYKQYLGEA